MRAEHRRLIPPASAVRNCPVPAVSPSLPLLRADRKRGVRDNPAQGIEGRLRLGKPLRVLPQRHLELESVERVRDLRADLRQVPGGPLRRVLSDRSTTAQNARVTSSMPCLLGLEVGKQAAFGSW